LKNLSVTTGNQLHRVSNFNRSCFFRDDEEDAVPVMKEPEVSKHCDNVREQEDEIAEIAVQYDVVDGQPMLKSDKEKECWALFKKMTAKGVSVTFDTVLRFGTLQ